jgi:hypothetical protein
VKNNKAFKFKTINILFLVIIGFLIFIRFYRAADFFSFNFDEEYQSHLAFEQIKNFHLIWIGVSASNIGFYLGPGFTYLNAFLFKLTNGDPISLAYFAPLMGVLTGFSLYFVVKEIFNKKAAFLSMIFYLGSSLVNFYDRRFWNPLLIPFITIWLFYFLYKAQKDSRYFIGVSFLLAASLHVHLSLLVFWPIVLFYVIKNIKMISLKTWVLSIGIYLIIISPLIVFDLVHNFDNLRMPLRYIQNKNIAHLVVSIATVNNHLTVWLNSLSNYLYITTAGNRLIALFSLIALGYLSYGAIKDRKKRFLLIMILSSVIFFILYPGNPTEYYLLNFFVLFPIALALFFEKVPVILTTLVVVLFITFNSLTVLNSGHAQFGLTVKKAAIEKVMMVVGDKSYALENYGRIPFKYDSHGGWRYLFRIYGKKPVTSFADGSFGWIYRDEISNEKPFYRVVVSEDIEYKSLKKSVLRFKNGAYYFYVFKVDLNYN